MALITKEALSDTNMLIYILFPIFSISSWLTANSVLAESPIFVNELPEGWRLTSILSLAVIVGNVGPIIFTATQKIAPTKVRECPVIYGILAVGIIASLLMSFFWDQTSRLTGQTTSSTALIILTVILATVDCTSSVVYRAYISFYKPQYISALFIGENLSGLIPGILGLAQGVGGDATCVNKSTSYINDSGNYTEYQLVAKYKDLELSVNIFFRIVASLFVVCAASFTFIHYSRYCDRARLTSKTSYNVTDEHQLVDDTDTGVANTPGVHNISFVALCEETTTYDMVRKPSTSFILPPADNLRERSVSIVTEADDCNTVEVCIKYPDYNAYLKSAKFRYMLFVICWSNLLGSGMLPGIQPYSCLPYGTNVYNLQLEIQLISAPFVCLFALFVSTSSPLVISILVALASLMMAHQIGLAALSPTPPLQHSEGGVFLVVLTGVLLYVIFTYVKVCIASIMHQLGGHNALMWYGIFELLGGSIGVILVYVIVNVYVLLESVPACPRHTQ